MLATLACSCEHYSRVIQSTSPVTNSPPDSCIESALQRSHEARVSKAEDKDGKSFTVRFVDGSRYYVQLEAREILIGWSTMQAVDAENAKRVKSREADLISTIVADCNHQPLEAVVCTYKTWSDPEWRARP